MKAEQQQEFIKQLNENQRIIHKICKIYMDNPSDHEDLFQEIVIQLWKAYPNFRGEAKFSTWAYRIGLNTALALFRKRKRDVPADSMEILPEIKIAEEPMTRPYRYRRCMMLYTSCPMWKKPSS